MLELSSSVSEMYLVRVSADTECPDLGMSWFHTVHPGLRWWLLHFILHIVSSVIPYDIFVCRDLRS